MEHAMGQMDGGQWVILVQRATLTVQLLHIKGGLHCRTDATQLHEGACSSSPLVAEPEGSAPLVPEPATGHDPGSVLSNSNPYLINCNANHLSPSCPITSPSHRQPHLPEIGTFDSSPSELQIPAIATLYIIQSDTHSCTPNNVRISSYKHINRNVKVMNVLKMLIDPLLHLL